MRSVTKSTTLMSSIATQHRAREALVESGKVRFEGDTCVCVED